jgi:short-subunit dehydrogenase
MTEATSTRRTAVVSGGGTGIGAAVAVQLVASGVEVLLVGRRPDRLEATAQHLRDLHEGAVVHTVVADLSEVAGAEVVRAVATELVGEVDVVIANAGSPAPRPATRWPRWRSPGPRRSAATPSRPCCCSERSARCCGRRVPGSS